MTPLKFGRYEIKAELGRGGMAVVYRAYDGRFKRDVAIKVLPHQSLSDAAARARFEREAQMIAAIEHPAITPVYDFAEEDGQPYLVMRFMPGGSLADRLIQGALPFAETRRITERIAAALDQVHAHAIVHRDLKPANVLFDQYGEAYLSDFGIARLAQVDTSRSSGAIIGTPAYMSPEQGRGEADIDGRTDIYALGVIVFQMLSGRQPYQASTPIGVVMKHITDPIPSLREARPDLPYSFDRVIEIAMAKERSQRFPTGSELLEALDTAARQAGEELKAGQPPTLAPAGSPVGLPATPPPLTPVQRTPPARWEAANQPPAGPPAEPAVNPFEWGPPVPPERFYGRAAQIIELRNRIGAISAQCVNVVGCRRSGKTSLLHYIQARPDLFFATGQRPLIVLLDFQDARCHSPAGILEGLRRSIERQTGQSPWKRDESEDPYAVEDGLLALREQGRRLILLLDEFEGLGKRLERFQNWGEDWRAKASAGLFALVIASKCPLREVYTTLELTSPFGNLFSQSILGALETEAWRKLAQEGFARSGRTLTPAQLNWIDEMAGGLPYYTQMAAALLWQANDLEVARQQFLFQCQDRFAELWRDLSPAERSALRAAGGLTGETIPPALAANLRLHGLLRPDGRPFSAVFVKDRV